MSSRRPTSILVLSRAEVLDLPSLRECIDAVECAFRLHAEGRTLGPGVLSVPATGGGFHVKAAGLVSDRCRRLRHGAGGRRGGHRGGREGAGHRPRYGGDPQ
jgi:hypothetical protein